MRTTSAITTTVLLSAGTSAAAKVVTADAGQVGWRCGGRIPLGMRDLGNFAGDAPRLPTPTKNEQ
jgi:hypothetical protein